MSFSEFVNQHPIVPYVRRASYGLRKEDKHTKERRLLEYHLHFIQKGSCILHVEGRAYPLQQGDIFLLQPGELNSLESKGDLIFPFIAMDLFYNPQRDNGVILTQGMVDLSPYGHLLQPRLNDIPGVRLPAHIQPHQPGRLRELILKTIAAWNKHDVFSQIEANNCAGELILTLMREFVEPHENANQQRSSLNWVPSFFDLFLRDPLKLEELAAKANLSTSHFSALFKKKFGVPPHRYLLQRRLEIAARLLRESELTLSEISEECGFADMQHLFKMFKKHFGVAPGAYRHQ